MSMHPDLKWLAENVSEWPRKPAKNSHIIGWNGLNSDGREPDYIRSYNPISCTYTKSEWLQARQELGLDNTETPEEKEELDQIEAMTRGMVDDFGNEYRDDHADMINKPPHYQLREGYEVYDLRQDLARKAQAAGVPHDQFSDWDRALEYLLRMWDKNGAEDAKKGAWYVNKLIEKLESSALRAGELGE